MQVRGERKKSQGGAPPAEKSWEGVDPQTKTDSSNDGKLPLVLKGKRERDIARGKKDLRLEKHTLPYHRDPTEGRSVLSRKNRQN